jgi:thymidylate kinase
MGIDGSGKTSIAKSLELKLRELNIDVKYYPTFGYFILRLPLKVLEKSANKTRERYFKGDKNPLSRLWPLLVFLDCVVTYLYFKLLKRHTIAIFDRYFYDFLVGFEFLGYGNKVVRKLFLCLPKPDILFILDVSPEIALKRKKKVHDMNVNFYKTLRAKYLRLANDIGIRTVNTEKPLEKSVAEIFTKISEEAPLDEFIKK